MLWSCDVDQQTLLDVLSSCDRGSGRSEADAQARAVRMLGRGEPPRPKVAGSKQLLSSTGQPRAGLGQQGFYLCKVRNLIDRRRLQPAQPHEASKFRDDDGSFGYRPPGGLDCRLVVGLRLMVQRYLASQWD
jgi:hypothetical protein